MAKIFFVGLDGAEKSYRLQTHRPFTLGRDPGNDIIVRVIGSEPMLAGKLLTMANSVALNTSGRKIADLPTAVARVGFNIVRSAALSFAVEQLRKASEYRHLEKQLDVLWKPGQRQG